MDLSLHQKACAYEGTTSAASLTLGHVKFPYPFHIELSQQKDDLLRQIESDLGSTFIENLDLIRAEQQRDDDISDAVAWDSSVVSSDDEDALLVYDNCSETHSAEQMFLEGEHVDVPSYEEPLPTDVVSGMPPLEDNPRIAAARPMNSSLPPVSLSHLTPLCGELKHITSETTAVTTATVISWNSARFREYQAEQWVERFEELKRYALLRGHCQISHRDVEHDSLAQWCKRQRYQYKLLQDGKPSTMTQDRIIALESLGFAFNAHEAVWFQRLSELKEFRSLNGHCNVPCNYVPNQKLSTWVKCQRRQYKLLMAGKKSNMTLSRVAELESLGMLWEVRPPIEKHVH
ncbi:helicase domain protein [Nitzschia inconspicua]|uniref:Helicase domain protein n=1 Tax=Nitzschia inconspicua TaxID=303405 RepID=A0A9K3PWH6_9STRA|nr:helicase domain protein [Nitzschia inconspicua]